MKQLFLISESEKNRILNLHKRDFSDTLLIENITPESIKQKYVDTGEVLKDTFEEIMKVSNNKINYVLWLTKMVSKNNILPEDIYKYEDYLKIFNKFKKHFPIKDINQIKTKNDLEEWLNIIIDMREKDVIKSDNDDILDQKNYVSPNNIKKLEDVGIEYMGLVDGYQIFEIPQHLSNNEESWRAYKDILGKCQGRETGAKIDICTIAGFDHYQRELNRGPLFVVFNLGDSLSPYQFSYESNQFMDRTDTPLF